MTVFLTAPNPPGIGFGPGAAFVVSTDTPPTSGQTAAYRVTCRNTGPSGQIFFFATYPYFTGNSVIILMDRPGSLVVSQVWYPNENATIFILFELLINGSPAGNTSVSDLWHETIWLGQQIANKIAPTTGSVHTIDDVWNSVNRQF